MTHQDYSDTQGSDGSALPTPVGRGRWLRARLPLRASSAPSQAQILGPSFLYTQPTTSHPTCLLITPGSPSISRATIPGFLPDAPHAPHPHQQEAWGTGTEPSETRDPGHMPGRVWGPEIKEAWRPRRSVICDAEDRKNTMWSAFCVALQPACAPRGCYSFGTARDSSFDPSGLHCALPWRGQGYFLSLLVAHLELHHRLPWDISCIVLFSVSMMTFPMGCSMPSSHGMSDLGSLEVESPWHWVAIRACWGRGND